MAWSSGFVGIRFAADYAPVLLVAFWRCVVVALALLPFSLNAIRRASPLTIAVHAGIGLLAMTGYLAGVSKGIEYGVPAGLAALIADLLPLGTALLSMLLQRRLPDGRVWSGLTLGVSGVTLATSSAISWGEAPLWSYLLPLAGMLSLALATLWQERLPRAHAMSLPASLGIQSAVSALAFAALAGNEGPLLPTVTTGFAIGVLWNALLATLAGYGLYWLCLKLTSALRVTSLLFLSPFVTFCWAGLMFNDPLSWPMLLGAATAGSGLWLLIRPAGRDEPKTAQHAEK
ncbi:DMT family transporter [Serratia marcescens]|uniref:DMT family transporter n=1 Tax=Serratia marcescens TaxID=615 RepID=UPI002880BFE9|nr:DMT family transporter [Serratia marcescens]MDT0226964.1 DMT family transporter [Serratia marcescens]